MVVTDIIYCMDLVRFLVGGSRISDFLDHPEFISDLSCIIHKYFSSDAMKQKLIDHYEASTTNDYRDARHGLDIVFEGALCEGDRHFLLKLIFSMGYKPIETFIDDLFKKKHPLQRLIFFRECSFDGVLMWRFVGAKLAEIQMAVREDRKIVIADSIGIPVDAAGIIEMYYNDVFLCEVCRCFHIDKIYCLAWIKYPEN